MWFRRTPPGQVRISRKEYVRLLEGAFKAQRLEEELRDLRHSAAEVRAKDLLNRNFRSGFYEERPAWSYIAEPDWRTILDDLPLTEEGHLHDQAFVAQLEALAWSSRERVLRDAMAAAGGPQ